MAKGGHNPGLIGEMIDRTFDILARGAIEELWDCLFHSVGEPGTRGLLRRGGAEFGKLLRERLRADDGSVERATIPFSSVWGTLYGDLARRFVEAAATPVFPLPE